MKHLNTFNHFIFEQKTNGDLKTPFINKPILLPQAGQKYSLPYQVTCGYKATNADELHAFQDTKSNGNKYDVGNMNMIVKSWLDYFYSQGINPQVSKVDIGVNGMDVTWTVTITKSQDGKAWIGFTSRGSATDESTAGQNLDKGKQNVTTQFPGSEIKDVFTYKHVKSGGGFGFVQHFIKYTNPQKPAHKSQQTSNQTQQQTTTQTTSTGKLLIDETALKMIALSDQVKAQTNVLIDETSIKVNLDTSPYTFKCNEGKNSVYLMKLVWNETKDGDIIPSAETIISKNLQDYPNTRILKQGKFANNTRTWAVIGLIK
jgi:hypothetical protein